MCLARSYLCVRVCTLELEVVVIGRRTEVQLQFGYELQISDLPAYAHAQTTHTHTRSKWFIKVYGGNAVVRTGNALSANLPNIRLHHFLSLEVESNKLHLLYFCLLLLIKEK